MVASGLLKKIHGSRRAKECTNPLAVDEGCRQFPVNMRHSKIASPLRQGPCGPNEQRPAMVRGGLMSFAEFSN